MSDRRYLSPLQVSQALGVSVTTVKRWVDDGVIPAHRTVGKHRKILLGDVVRLVHEGNLPRVDLSLLTGPLPAPDPAQLVSGLVDFILAGQTDRAKKILQDAYRAGLPVEEIADKLIAPAMAQLGHGWADGQIDVYQEHRGTQVCLNALQILRDELPLPGNPAAPLAVGGGPENDHYLLANVLVELTLVQNGWRAVNLGPNTPVASFQCALIELSPRLLWISCSYLADSDAFLRQYRKLYGEAEKRGVAVAVGGKALTDKIRSRMPYTKFGDGLAHLAAFVRELRVKSPPRR
jgi:excisionase family DNA binding protein